MSSALYSLVIGIFHCVGTASQLMTVGMVGYPNVGKSSTINTLLKKKVVPVSNTPGKTKHLQVRIMIMQYTHQLISIIDDTGRERPVAL